MRQFTETEIQWIVKDLESMFPTYLPPLLKRSYVQSMINELSNLLRKEWIEDDFDDWNDLKQRMETKVAKSIIQAGESVGVLCAQSIGERQTQLSIEGRTLLCFQQKGQWHTQCSIQSIVDHLIQTRSSVVLEPNKHEVFPCWDSDEFKIPMVDPHGLIHLAPIIEWSRHRNVGPLMTITTKTHQKQVKTTLSHSYVIKNKRTGLIEPILGSDLKRGDEIPLLLYDDIKQVSFQADSPLLTHWDSISHIQLEEGEGEWVYDISVDGNQTFMIENGLFVHNTLNSFHQSGLTVATVITGVPRFMELLNATKSPKMSSTSFEFKILGKTIGQYKEMIGHQLIETQLMDVYSHDIIYMGNKLDEYWYSAYELLYGNSFRQYSNCISFFFRKDRLFERRLSLVDIKTRIESIYHDLICVISPLHAAQIDIFIDVSKIDRDNFLSVNDPYLIYIKHIVRPKLLELMISGIHNIKNYYFQKSDTGQWRVETLGSNFLEILSLNFINHSSVKSNNLWDIFQVMGIEATRQFLIEEFQNVVSSDGTFINPSHILLLVDIMTYQGTINSVSRYGMRQEDMGVLSRASFEESLDQFCKAGCYAEFEPIKAVSAKIMCGKRPTMGSGLCHLQMDWNKIMEHDQSTLPTQS